MSIIRIYALFSATLLILFSIPQISRAAASISVDQAGNITGQDLNSVAGLELTIGYDSSLLTMPKVTKGNLIAKGMLVANTAVPGTIKIAILSLPPFSGSGQLATVSFTTNPSAKGGIKSIAVTSMIDSKSTQIPVQYSVSGVAPDPASAATEAVSSVLSSTPGVPFTPSPTTIIPVQQQPVAVAPVTDTPASATLSTDAKPDHPPTTPSTITSAPAHTSQQTTLKSTVVNTTPQSTVVTTMVLSKSQQSIQDDPQPPPPSSPAESQPSTPTEPTTTPVSLSLSNAKEQTPQTNSGQLVVFKSIADRFKTYQGDKSLTIMTALFRMEPARFIRQEPAVVLSDGKSKIRIIIDLPAENTSSPNFALDNATFLSVNSDSKVEGRWTIEALPDKNAWKGVLNIIVGPNSYEYPLTVAPSISAAIKTDQAGWELFMKKISSSQKLSYDFNRDGILDYIDEFIFIANHLAGR